MSDTSPEDQAALAIVFEENIRELVRKHLKEALEDWGFLNSVYMHPMAAVILGNLNTSTAFHNTVKNVIAHQMNKP
jgi:hypothetical protein